MKRAFTLVELLVVVAIISLLMAIGLPVMKQVRERGAEAVCQSNLRQMVLAMKAYCNDHDSLFPNPTFLYHSKESFTKYPGSRHPWMCRWHDAEIGPGSHMLLYERKEFQGELMPYVKNAKVLLCKAGARANLERGCNLDSNEPRRPQPYVPGGGGFGGGRMPDPNDPITIVPQYTYTMNGNLHRILVGGGAAGSMNEVNAKTVRTANIHKETQVTRSHSDVFAFGEENSWAINKRSRWPASYNLSGAWGGYEDGCMEAPFDLAESKARMFRVRGSIVVGSLDIGPSYTTFDTPLEHPYASRMPETDVGNAFATYHRPRGGDLNAGHSYVSMLDGHVEKVTVADQLRASRRDPSLNMPESRFGPGGNLRPAWPLDIPPLCGWENQ